MIKTGLTYPIKNKHILFRHDFDGQSYGLMNDTKKKAWFFAKSSNKVIHLWFASFMCA